MAIKEILLLGNPMLRRSCERVKNFNDPELHQTIRDLRDTLNNFCKLKGFGRGIAAPQIGVLKKIIFINIDKPMALINPEIIHPSKQIMTLWDDCFSFPDLMVKVKRNTKIDVSYRDENGKKQIIHAVGDLAELFQHEIDHLSGILAIDRAIDAKHIVYRSEMEKLLNRSKDHIDL